MRLYGCQLQIKNFESSKKNKNLINCQRNSVVVKGHFRLEINTSPDKARPHGNGCKLNSWVSRKLCLDIQRTIKLKVLTATVTSITNIVVPA